MKFTFSFFPTKGSLILSCTQLISVVASLRGVARNECGPLKVFILSGQSNMVGRGSIEHLQKLLNDPQTHDEYANLWNETSNDWIERGDVYVSFYDHVGRLEPGYGTLKAHGGHFGPELGFGWVVGDNLISSFPKSEGDDNGCKQRILLLKVAEDGSSLATDFRPPSSKVKKIFKEDWQRPEIESESDYGWLYRRIINDIQTALTYDNLSKILPDYNETDGYELCGFVWFQGFNDSIHIDYVQEYRTNLMNFIRDIRDDLNTPDLPFVIGELGIQGNNITNISGSDRIEYIRFTQRTVPKLKEFYNTTRFVPTAKYFNNSLGTLYNRDFHYYGRADTYYSIGKAFGYAMLELLEGAEES